MARTVASKTWRKAAAISALLALSGCEPAAPPVAKKIDAPPILKKVESTPPPVVVAEAPKPEPTPPPAPEPPPVIEAPAAAPEPIAASMEAAAISRLFQETDSMEVAKLLGKKVEISGYVLQVRNLGAQRLVVLGDEHFSDELPAERVLCHIEQDMSEAASIASPRLRVTGTCQLGYGNLVVLRNCVIAEELPALEGFEDRKIAFAEQQNENELKKLGVQFEGDADNLSVKLNRLHFQAGRLRPEIRNRLQDVSGLRIMRLSGLPITDAGLNEIPFLARLHEIALDSTRISAEGLAPLAEATELRRVTLDGTTQNQGFSHLARATHLESLEIIPNQGQSEFSEEAVSHLQSLRSVTKLVLDGANLSPAVMNWIAEQKNLKTLSLKYTNLSPELLSQLTSLAAIESISLSGSNLDDAGVAALSAFENLRNLDLANTEVTDAGMAQFQPSKSLVELDLSGNRIFGGGLTSLRGSNIESLSLRGARADNEALLTIESLTSLKRLRIGYTSISYAALSRLAPLQNLELLDLTGIRLQKETLPVLEGLASLKELRLSENPFDDCEACLNDLAKSRPGLSLFLGRYDFLAQTASITP